MDSFSYLHKDTLLAAKGGCICNPLTPPKSATGNMQVPLHEHLLMIATVPQDAILLSGEGVYGHFCFWILGCTHDNRTQHTDAQARAECSGKVVVLSGNAANTLLCSSDFSTVIYRDIENFCKQFFKISVIVVSLHTTHHYSQPPIHPIVSLENNYETTCTLHVSSAKIRF